jgi:hypothetical protein
MRLANESDKTVVRDSPSQAQVDQLEGCLLEKPIPYISNDNFSQEDIFDYWNGKLSGHAHVKRTYPDVVRMWRQFHGCPGSGDGIERVFTAAGKQHDTLKKSTMDKTLENTLKTGMNTKLPTCDDEDGENEEIRSKKSSRVHANFFAVVSSFALVAYRPHNYVPFQHCRDP